MSTDTAAPDAGAESEATNGANLPSEDEVLLDMKQTDELISRLTAVRGSLLDHLDDNPILYEGVPAALDFVDRICQRIKKFILGEGSGPLQSLLVTEVGLKLHAIDLQRHFTHDNMQKKIKQMNGYQTHLMSPETAIHGVISDAFTDVAPIAQWMVEAVRMFLREVTVKAGEAVWTEDPQKREQLAKMIVEATDDIFDVWQKEAEEMARVVMDMEKSIVSPVFWRRLTYMRKHVQASPEVDTSFQGRASTQLRSARDAAGGFFGNMSNIVGRRRGKAADSQDGQQPNSRGSNGAKPPPIKRGGRGAPPMKTLPAPRRGSNQSGDADDDVSSAESGTPSGRRPPNVALNMVGHIPNWSVGYKKLNLKTGTVMYLVGKLKKKSHGKLTTSAWKERWFAFSEEFGELYYWRKQPSPDTAGDPVAIVYMPDAKLTHATIQELAGLDKQVEGNTYLGLRIDSAAIKGKHDEIIIAFETAADKKKWGDALGTAMSSTAAAQRAARTQAKAAAEKEKEREREEDDDDEDEDGPQTPIRGDASMEDSQELNGHDGSGDLDDGSEEEPLTPTKAYTKGGLGMGSNYFSAEDDAASFGMESGAGKSKASHPLRNIGEDRALMARERIDTPEAVEVLASDSSVYVTIVTDSISAALPKVAVMNLVERILAGDLMNFLQKRVLEWPPTTTDAITTCSGDPMTTNSKDATNFALKDIETEMVNVRMACQSANTKALITKQSERDIRCGVSVHALALGGYSRMLSAANKGDARNIMSTRYGPLFPIHALETADSATKHRETMKSLIFDRTVNVQANDPLYSPADMTTHDAPEGADSMRKSSGVGGGSVNSMVNMTKHMFGKGMTSRKAVTDADVEEEHRRMDTEAANAPARQSRPALSAASTNSSAFGGGGGDPLGGGGFGGDPLGGRGGVVNSRDPMAQQKAATMRGPQPPSDDSDSEDEPAQSAADARFSQRMAAGNSDMRGASSVPSHASIQRPAPLAPRRAPMAPARAPPGRPAPLRAPPAPMIGGPGRPGLAPSRPAPMNAPPMGAPMSAPRAASAANPLQNSAQRQAPPRSNLPL